jgi:hypothetical protein
VELPAHFRDASRDSDPARPIQKGDRHGRFQSSNFVMIT